MIELLAPRTCALNNGPIQSGLYREDFGELNLEYLPHSFHRLDPRNLYINLRSYWRNSRIKRWQHFAFASDHHWISIALVNATYSTAAWISVFNLETKEHFEHNLLLPGSMGRIAREHFNGHTYLHTPRDRFTIEVKNQLAHGGHELSFSAKAGKTPNKPEISGKIFFHETKALVQPLIVLKDLSQNRPFYTHKVACPIEGVVTVAGEEIVLKKTNHSGLIDIHAAYYPHVTQWFWATFSALDQNGKPFGVNLTSGTAWPQNQTPNENAIWYNGELTPLGDANIQVPENKDETWKISTCDNRVKLEFKPIAERRANQGAIFIESRYAQPTGKFYGQLIPQNADPIEINGILGCTEDHFAKW